MLKTKGRNFDNVSIAQTKSSKTLKSKLNINPEVEVKKFDPPYFKEENITKDIETRAKKENQRFGGLVLKVADYSHLDKAHHIVQDLLNRHRLAKEKLNRMKEESQRQAKVECPFRPERKGIEKFVVTGDVVRRNETWLMQKRKRSVMRKEQTLENDLAQCTFSPDITRSKGKREHSKSTLTKPRECHSPSPAPHSRSKQRDLSRSSYETAKKDIYQRLLTMF